MHEIDGPVLVSVVWVDVKTKKWNVVYNFLDIRSF